MRTSQTLLKHTGDGLRGPSRKRLKKLLPDAQAATLRVAAHTVSADGGHHAIVTVVTGNAGGQYLLRWHPGREDGDDLIHADTLVFPLPPPVRPELAVPEPVLEELSLQLNRQLAEAAGLGMT
jgi:hypothetical protein